MVACRLGREEGRAGRAGEIACFPAGHVAVIDLGVLESVAVCAVTTCFWEMPGGPAGPAGPGGPAGIWPALKSAASNEPSRTWPARTAFGASFCGPTALRLRFAGPTLLRGTFETIALPTDVEPSSATTSADADSARARRDDVTTSFERLRLSAL